MPENELNELAWTPPTHPSGCECDGCKDEMACYEEAARILREAGFVA